MHHRAYRFRGYPTGEQALQPARTFGCVRLVCNKALDYRHKAYFHRRESVTCNQTSAMPTVWKRRRDLAFPNEASSVPLQQALRHLRKGYSNFFKGYTAYPRFKKKRVLSGSAEYTRSAFKRSGGRLTLAKQAAPLKIRWSRKLPVDAGPSTVTATPEATGR